MIYQRGLSFVKCDSIYVSVYYLNAFLEVQDNWVETCMGGAREWSNELLQKQVVILLMDL